MSYNKTDGIPHDHPLAQLLARSQKANKLPSCEGCRWISDAGGVCSLARSEDGKAIHGHAKAVALDGEGFYAFLRLKDATHFCAAWEPKQ